MDDAALLEFLIADGPRLVAAARSAGWDAPVPGLDWTVREVVVHTGAVHRWAADLVGRALAANETGGSRAFHPDDALTGEPLADWFADAHHLLVDTLNEAPADLRAWTFGGATPPREFWIRRQAHELAVHRADLELAAGTEPDVDDDFAQDGIAELMGMARGRRFAVAQRATVGLDAADGPSWLITFGGERTTGVPSEDLTGTDVTVRGRSADLYLWLWNRRADVMVDGDEAAAALWTRTVRL